MPARVCAARATRSSAPSDAASVQATGTNRRPPSGNSNRSWCPPCRCIRLKTASRWPWKGCASRVMVAKSGRSSRWVVCRVFRRAPGGANVDGLQAVAPHPPGQVAHEGARRVANRGRAHRALQHGGEEGAEELVRDGPQTALRTAPLPLPTWALEHAPQTPAPAGGQCAGGRECCQDRSRGSGCRWSCPFQRIIMGSPSRNVQ